MMDIVNLEKLWRRVLGRALRGERMVSLEEDGYRIIVLSGTSWKSRFLSWLSEGKSVGQAAELSGVSRWHAYRCRAADADFRAAWDRIRGI